MKFTPLSESDLAASGLLADGTYHFEVAKCEESVSKTGNPMFKIQITVFGDWDATVFDYLVLSAKAAFKLAMFAKHTGLWETYQRGELEAHDLQGVRGWAKIAQEKSEGYNPKNVVRAYVDKPEESSLPPAKSSKAPGVEEEDDIPF